MKLWRLAAFLLIFDALALALFYPHIDLFSCGYLFFTTFLAIFQTIIHQRFSVSPEISKLFYAQHVDFLWDKLVPLLGALELLVFFEYSHRLLPFDFAWRKLQVLGLLLLLLATVWLVLVDRYFLRNF
jgi:hypothetical protein